MATTVDPAPASLTSGSRRRDVRRVRRFVAAGVLLVPAGALAIGRLFATDDSDTRTALDLIAADPNRAFTFVLLGFVAILTLVPAVLAAGRLAIRRRPVLTTAALGVNLVAYLCAPVLGIDSMYLAGAALPIEQRDGAAALIDAIWSTGLVGLAVSTMFIGQVLGAILMGLALRGSIHAVGWVAMVVSQPIQVIAFILIPDSVSFDHDVLAWGLMALAFVFCAVAVLQTPDDEWDLPPLS